MPIKMIPANLANISIKTVQTLPETLELTSRETSLNRSRWFISTMMYGNWFIRMILKAKKIFDIFNGTVIISRFRQLEEEKRAINRVDMRFVALYSTLEMLYGNPSLKYFFEFFIQFFRLIIFPVKSKFKGCIQCGADLGTGIG